MDFTSDISIKIRTAINVKLAEIGNDVYEELPDYIMVMVANRRNEEEMTEELSLFLGDKADRFTSWLHSLLSKLQYVASGSPETKADEGNLASASAAKEQSKSAVATYSPCHGDSASEHSNDEDASCVVPISNAASKTVQNPQEDDEQSDSQRSPSSFVDHADSTSRGSDNEPSVTLVTGDSDNVKTENSKTDNGTSEEGIRKRKKHSATRVFRVKSRKLESESDSSKSHIVSSSKLASGQGTDGSDSEKETKSYTLTQIRKMKQSNNNTSSEVSTSVVKTESVENEKVGLVELSSSVIKTELVESEKVVEPEGKEKQSLDNHDQKGDCESDIKSL
ncbi:hypothetical protein ACOMHN_016091 [Nucella lapillus]